jgi:hypothetical protein
LGSEITSRTTGGCGFAWMTLGGGDFSGGGVITGLGLSGTRVMGDKYRTTCCADCIMGADCNTSHNRAR